MNPNTPTAVTYEDATVAAAIAYEESVLLSLRLADGETLDITVSYIDADIADEAVDAFELWRSEDAALSVDIDAETGISFSDADGNILTCG